MTPSVSAGHRAPVSSPFGAGLGLPAGTVAVCLAWTSGTTGVVTVGLVTAAVAAAAVSTLTGPAGSLVAGVQCWALYDGFAAHRLGELHFSTSDIRVLAVVVGSAAAGHVVARAVRRPHPWTTRSARRSLLPSGGEAWMHTRVGRLTR